MLKRLKDTFAFVCMVLYTKTMKFLYKDEIKSLEEKLKDVLAADQKKTLDAIKAEANSLPVEQKELLNQYAKLQNEIFKVFMQFTKEMQAADGSEMDGIAQIWATTVVGLNKTLQQVFLHQDDGKIKQCFKLLDEELQMAIDTNQEIVGVNKVGGGFGYSGPMGQA